MAARPPSLRRKLSLLTDPFPKSGRPTAVTHEAVGPVERPADSWPSELARGDGPLQLHERTMVDAQGLKIATYAIRAREPVGAILLIHGARSCARYEFLRPRLPGEPNTCWEGSLMEQLVSRGISVYALDHQSHGASEGKRGLRCDFDSIDDLAADVRQLHVQTAAELGAALPIFWLGHSMGGCTVTRAIQQMPAGAVAGLVATGPLISADRVFDQPIACGLTAGDVLPRVLSLLRRCAPGLPLVATPPSPLEPHNTRSALAEPHFYHGNIRVSLAASVFGAARGFKRRGGPLSLERVRCPALLAIHSYSDALCEWEGSASLFERASCARKTLVLLAGIDPRPGRRGELREAGDTEARGAFDGVLELPLYHNLVREPGGVAVGRAIATWVRAEAVRQLSVTLD